MASVRYRFAGFTLSPCRRVLTRAGREIPLIPRYFDLLVLLVERRAEAVSRRTILETVWDDVVVSDGALSQAVRSLRRALDDDPRQPRFIRTMSRHGYRFIHEDVVQEPDDGPDRPDPAPAAPPGDAWEQALSGLLDESAAVEERRDAGGALHALGTGEALARLEARGASPAALAILRETRWDVAGAGDVPLLGRPDGWRALLELARMRLRDAARVAGERWAWAAAGGGAAGVVAGSVGGLVLMAAPGSEAPASIPLALSVVGAILGAVGAAGVGAGLAAAEALARSVRGTALTLCGAAGGGAIGFAAHLVGGWTLHDLFGRDLSAVGGGLEGLAIGAACGLGYAVSTPRPGGGMAAPRGWARARSALITGACCALACMAVAAAGGRLGGDSLDLMTRSYQGSHAGLTPLARLLGEPEVGPVTRTVLGAWEGLLFGSGLAFGLTRRPR